MSQLRVENVVHSRDLHPKQLTRLVVVAAATVPLRAGELISISTVCGRKGWCEAILPLLGHSCARGSQRKAKSLRRLWRQLRGLLTPRPEICACTAGILSRSRMSPSRAQRLRIVLLPYKSLNSRVYLVDVNRHLRPHVLRVVGLVTGDVAHLFHVLDLLGTPGVH